MEKVQKASDFEIIHCVTYFSNFSLTWKYFQQEV
jgi:hypothetical protein